jgi:hypothetical protein
VRLDGRLSWDLSRLVDRTGFCACTSVTILSCATREKFSSNGYDSGTRGSFDSSLDLTVREGGNQDPRPRRITGIWVRVG